MSLINFNKDYNSIYSNCFPEPQQTVLKNWQRETSLENEHLDLVTQNVDVKFNCDFVDYLRPNEMNPEGIKEHLKLAKRGIHVSTGTERSFFGIIFSKRCEGLIVVDINHRVKAYVDFNTLLIRISQNVQEYAAISFIQDFTNEEINQKIDVIKHKLYRSKIPNKMRDYYLKNLKDFANIYYGNFDANPAKAKQEYRKDFDKVRYYNSQKQFSKIKKLADAGNIISVIGQINDLSFINRNISVIDSSNISDYFFINPKMKENFCPRIIRTSSILLGPCCYSSFEHTPLSDDDTDKFDRLLKIFYLANGDASIPEFFNHNTDKFNDSQGPFYNKTSLNALEEYVNNNIIELPIIGFVDIGNYHEFSIKINNLSLEEVKSILKNRKALSFFNKHLSSIIRFPFSIKSDLYIGFSELPEWNDEFEKYFSLSLSNLPEFLEYLKDEENYDKFVETFGEDRLNALVLKASQ